MLGRRLKEARIEAGLSQRQLCGDTITRNMLSQIESGKARPSMQTLQYLAQMLGKPVSWFLDELPPEVPADPTPEQARKYYRKEKYQECLELLESCLQEEKSGEEELWLMRTLCQMALAQQAMGEGKFRYAHSLLEKAAVSGKHTPYYTQSLERERVLMLYRCDPERAGELLPLLPEDDREQLLRADSFLRKGEFATCMTVLHATRKQGAYWHLLYGQAAMGQREYALAAEHFHRAEESYPIPCAKALETCYRELEDYKMAYQYACKQR